MPTASVAELLLHPRSREQLTRFVQRPPQSLLITGPDGIGKSTLAAELATQVLALQTALSDYPYQLQIVPEEAGKAISIEAVRQIEHFLAHTVPSKQAVSRVIIIHMADTLTPEAQNVLLKTLEEPPLNTMFMLTAAQPDQLLPTIRSRVQQLAVQRPTNAQLHDWLEANGLSSEQNAQIMAMSGGLPGLAAALIAGDQQHPLVEAAAAARQILTVTSFERLCMVDDLAKDKQRLRNVLAMLAAMAHGALVRGGTANDRWQHLQTQIYEAEAALINGGQPKLVLSTLMLNM